MTAEAAVRSTGELQSLYTRYKSLAISVSAAIILSEPTAALEEEVAGLLESCRARDDGSPLSTACIEAAESLRQLVVRAGGDAPTEADVEATRETHRQLRTQVWGVLPCEYVPCCAGAPATGS